MQCSTGDFCPAGSVEPNTCDEGFYCPDPSQQIECSEPGVYCPSGSTEPQPCEAGYRCEIPALKTKCIAGQLCEVNSTNSQSCSRGRYCPDGKEEFVCSYGSYCKLNSAQPASCIAGNYCPDPTEQIICPKGHFCLERSLLPTPCPRGTFRPDTGGAEETTCFDCPQAMSTFLGGSIDVTQCLCDIGYFVAPDDASTCIECDRERMVCADVGTTVETIIPAPGFWRSDSSSLAFIPCPYGSGACSGIPDTISGGDQLSGMNSSSGTFGECMPGKTIIFNATPVKVRKFVSGIARRYQSFEKPFLAPKYNLESIEH